MVGSHTLHMDDQQLLQEYTDRGSEEAFRALVDRYLGLVYSAAHRQVHDDGLAKDVSQAVFFLLARKAGGMPRQSRLSGWLYQTTCFVARRALRSENRRREREHLASAMHITESHTQDKSWNEVSQHLDWAMSRLGAKDRQALLVRYFEQRTHRDVAAELGVGEEAAKKRIQRALEKLRVLLSRAGVGVSLVALGTLLAEYSVQAAPGGLSACMVPPTAASAGGVAVPSASVRLVEETVRAWRWARLTWGAATSMIGVMILVWMAGRMGEGIPDAASRWAVDGNDRVPTEVRLAGGGEARSAGVIPEVAAGRVLLFRLVDQATGEGVAARLAIQKVVGTEWLPDLQHRTDASGFAEIDYEEGTSRMDVGILEHGWVARYATFSPHKGDPIPEEYTLRVGRSSVRMGGWVRDEAGGPVVGAEIRISFEGTGDASTRETPRERPGCPIWKAPIATTDSQGRWSMELTMSDAIEYYLTARHPEFAEGPVGSERWAEVPLLEPAPGTERPAVGVLRRGAEVMGRVVGIDGEPVEGAMITMDPYTLEEVRLWTDPMGGFVLPRKEGHGVAFSVTAAGMAPAVLEVKVTSATQPLEIVLQPGGRLRLALVDEDGNPVSDAEVIMEQWKDHRHLLKWSARSDAGGRVMWEEAPTEGVLELCARGHGWCYTRDIRVEPGDEEHRIVMRRVLRLAGRVLDDVSGTPLAEFKVFPGYGEGEHRWERLDTRRGTDGDFAVEFSEKKDPWRLRVEAEGYLPWVSEPIDPKRTEPLEVRLRRLEPGMEIRGVVVRADGQPAPGVEVALLTLEHDVSLLGRKFRERGTDDRVKVTDGSGEFRFQPDPAAHSVVAAGPEGFGQVRFRTERGALTVPLLPWGRIEGDVDASARGPSVEGVWMLDPLAQEYRGRVQVARSSAPVDRQHRFVFEDVPPGEWVFCINQGSGKPLLHKTPVAVVPGETTHIRIVRRGARVSGRLLVLEAAPSGLEASAEIPSMAWMLSQHPAPPPDRPMGFNTTMAAVEAADSEAARAWAFWGLNVRLQLGSDGRFTSESDCPPGEYLVRAYVRGKEGRGNLVVPEWDGDADVVDLGDVLLGGKSR